MPKSTKVCDHCGRPFEAYKDSNHFCSRNCYHASKLKHPPTACKQCGKVFQPRGDSRAMFCSPQCRIQSTGRAAQTCEFCGTLFRSRRHGGPQRYCSLQCSTHAARVIFQSVAPVEKKCSRCGETKPVSEYSLNAKTGKPWHSYCKACGRIIAHGHYLARSEDQRKRYNASHKRKRAEERAADPEAIREQYKRGSLRKYGLTLDSFMALLVAQDGKCAICGIALAPGRGRNGTAVDHCHRTGKVRGLLCTRCNHGLGSFEDDPSRLSAAALYLEPTLR